MAQSKLGNDGGYTSPISAHNIIANVLTVVDSSMGYHMLRTKWGDRSVQHQQWRQSEQDPVLDIL